MAGCRKRKESPRAVTDMTRRRRRRVGVGLGYARIERIDARVCVWPTLEYHDGFGGWKGDTAATPRLARKSLV
jgi:hypothetical protein